MEVNEWLSKVSYKDKDNGIDGEEITIYKSRFDDSYITMEGQEDNIKYLADREITEELTHGVGFSHKDGKWYGWSHRGIFGFKIGSECKKGNCHYTAGTPEDLIDDYANFFADISQECADNHRAECQILDDRSGIRILKTPIRLPMISNINDLEKAIDSPDTVEEVNLFEDSVQILKCGRGEWIAETLEDAKQMAIDFNEDVS